MESLKRTFYSFTTAIGYQKGTTDNEYQFLKNSIENVSKHFTNIVKQIENLPKTISAISKHHNSIIMSFQAITQQSNVKREEISTQLLQMREVFDKISEDSQRYESLMNELYTPIRTYGEQFNELLNRCKICEKRKEDYDYWNRKLNKAMGNNNKNIAQIQSKFISAQQSYEWLKNELIEDNKKLCNDAQLVTLPVIRSLYVNFTEILNGINSVWSDVSKQIEKLPIDGINLEYVIRPSSFSFIREENVKAQQMRPKTQEVNTMYQNQYQNNSIPQNQYYQYNVNNYNQMNPINPYHIQSTYGSQYPSQRNESVYPNSTIAVTTHSVQQNSTYMPQQMNEINQNNKNIQYIENNQINKNNEIDENELNVPPSSNEMNENNNYENQTNEMNHNQYENYERKESNESNEKKHVLLCKVLYDYDAQDDKELTMKEGDTIAILSKENDWWIGELNGKTGQFPSNYVVIIQE